MTETTENLNAHELLRKSSWAVGFTWFAWQVEVETEASQDS